MGNNEHKQTLAYIIDSDFKIVYSNKELKYIVPDAKLDQCCYEIFGNEHGQCSRCPLREKQEGTSFLFDHLREEWVSVSSAAIEIPGLGTCHVIINDSMSQSSNSFLYDAAGKSDYAELLELDYGNDFFRVAYHGERKNDQSPISGTITEMVNRLTERVIHPDDRVRFRDFWLMDWIGSGELPVELFTARHGEFRRLRPDGSYDWVQQVMLPIRQSSKTEIFVNNFFNIIDMPTVRQLDPQADSAIHGKDEFFRLAEGMLARAGETAQWSLIAIDVEKLKLFNEWYGRQAGDRMLESITQCLLQHQNGRDRIAGHFYDDDFAFLMPHDELEIRRLCQAVSAQIKLCSDKMNTVPAFGVYTVTGSSEPIFGMYDRAKLACAAVKGNFSSRIKYFDTEMLERLQAEYLLLSDIQKAFQNHEFTFQLQPKCNTRTGRVAGAEALARWNNPEKGMISPGTFVPFLEKSGLISELDTYIWEDVCRWQRSVLDRGLPAIPVSVNVSRIDIYAVNVAQYFQDLIHKYNLDPALIEIEITESAYAEDINAINRVVRDLRGAGFQVLMDDFGSAYSSLNMLKDIEVDVLKIDMRFLDSADSNHRGVNIVETICHMAHLLGLKIVAEGVETKAQRDMLLKAGCTYSQGYYFHRPLLIGDFEALVAQPEQRDNTDQVKKQDELFHLKDLLIQNAFSLNMLDNIIGAMAFYDVCGDDINIIRFNEQYAALLGSSDSFAELNLRFGQQLLQEEFSKIFRMFDEARQNPAVGSELDLRRRKLDGSEIWINMRVFYLHSRQGHDIFYSTVRDVTKIHRSNEVLQFLNNDMPGGYYRHLNDADGTLIHISQRFLDIFGFTRQEITELFDDKLLNMVHPDDRSAVRSSMAAMEQSGGNYTQPYRIQSKNGYIFVLDQSRLVHYEGDTFFQGIILFDFDHYLWLKESTNANDSTAITTLMPCGFFLSDLDGDHQFGFISQSLYRMLGYTRQEFAKKFRNNAFNLVYHKDRERVQEEFLQQLQQSNFISCEYRVEMVDGTLKWVYCRARLATDRNGVRWLHTCIIDHDYLRDKYEVQHWQYLKYKSLSSIPGAIVFDYDPEADRLTVEEAAKSGHVDTMVSEHYVENIEQFGLISKEHVGEQRRILTHASAQAISGVTEFRGRFSRQNGYRWYRFRFSSLADESGHVYRVIGRGDDISDEKLTISSLTHRATKDSLTGLYNYEAAKAKSGESLRKNPAGTLILLDIDNFKDINDTLGHLVGDRLLKMLGSIIHSTFRRDGICARFGGDEFLVFIPGITDPSQIEELMKKLYQATARVQLGEKSWLRCSVGIASCDHGITGTVFDTLFTQADAALYHAKRSGKNRYTFYTEDMHGILL